VLCKIKIRGSELISELEHTYQLLEEALREHPSSTIVNDISKIMRMIYELKIKHLDSEVKDGVKIVELIRRARESIESFRVREWLHNVENCIIKWRSFNKEKHDRFINALLHQILKALISSSSVVKIEYDVPEPTIEAKPPPIFSIFVRDLRRSGLGSLVSYRPDSYMCCTCNDKTFHLFVEFKIHRSSKFDTLFIESVYSITKFSMFIRFLSLITTDEELTINVCHGKRVTSSSIILTILHITDLVHYESSHICCARITEPGPLGRLNARLIVWSIPVLDVYHTRDQVSRFRDVLCRCLCN